MKTMRLYRISLEDLGDTVIFEPHDRRLQFKEDRFTKRVCACPTVSGCIRSLQIPNLLNPALYHKLHELNEEITIPLYTADVPVEYIEQPTPEQVFDEFATGELWVMKALPWRKETNLHIKYYTDLPREYKRYMFRYDGASYPPLHYFGPDVFGNHNAFTMIGFECRIVEEWPDLDVENPPKLPPNYTYIL